MKHINNIWIICYGWICVNMKRNDGKASVIFTSTKQHSIADIYVYVELTVYTTRQTQELTHICSYFVRWKTHGAPAYSHAHS
jgi:hypothetical protein